MATSGLYGTSVSNPVQAVPGTESNGLYGNSINYGGTYFEWFIFQEAATQPATPTGGSWNFSTNVGTPPSGWSLLPPSAPVNQVWVSIAIVNSRSAITLAWTEPGLFGVVPNFTFPTPITGAAGTDAAVVNLGTASNPSLQFTIPRGDKGDTGDAATVAVGTTTTLPAGDPATVTNSGTSHAAVFDFGIPQGIQGDAATIAVGTTTTGAAGSSASVTNSGTSSDAVFNFTIPRGDTGATGTAATIAVGTTTTTAPGTSATVTNSGTSAAAVFNFGIPRGAGVVAGGSTGQVLAKASSTDYDTTWINIVGGLNYQGAWNASTNTPTLTSGVGTNGYYYVVSVAGSTNLDGITDWQVGDWAIYNGTAWQKIDQTNTVTSVNGLTGAVVLTPSIIGALSSATSSDGSITVSQVGTVIDLVVSAASPASTLLLQVKNNTGSTLTKGTVVYVNGAVGQLPTVAKAQANAESTSAQTQGMITADIANGGTGYVTIVGLVTDFDTSAFSDGQQVYLSGTVAGGITGTKPYAPTHLVYVGVVTYSHAIHGKIQVKVQNGYELDELHNVSAQTPTTGQTIVYNSATSLWEQNTVSLTAGVNGTLPIANGGTGQTTANAAFNALAPSQATNTGKYLTTDGTNTSWASVYAGATISNDTATSTNVYPLFAAATSGVPTSIYTSNAKYLYKPSTGELQSSVVTASDGLFMNSQTISTSRTIPVGSSAMSSGPITIASGQSITISSGSRWVVV